MATLQLENPGTGSYHGLTATTWYGEWFEPPNTFLLTTLKFRAMKHPSSYSGYVTVKVYKATVGYQPYGDLLASATYNVSSMPTYPGSGLVSVDLSAFSVMMAKGQQYCFYVDSSTGTGAFMFYGGDDPDGVGIKTINAGSSWTADSDKKYEIWGDTIDMELTLDSVTPGVESAVAQASFAGSEAIDEYGFDYEEAGANEPSTYSNEVTESGSPSSPFQTTMPGLTASGWYWCRPKVHLTDYGWLYGTAEQFQVLFNPLLVEYSSNDSGSAEQYITNQYRGYVLFTPVFGHVLRGCKLVLKKSGDLTNGIFYVALYETSANKPTGTALLTASMPTSAIAGTPTEYHFDFGDGDTVDGGTTYALVCWASVGTYSPAVHIEWIYGSGSPGGGRSQDYGASWIYDGSGKYYRYSDWGASGIETYPATNIEPLEATGWGYLQDGTDITKIGFDVGTESGVYTDEFLDESPPYYEGTFSLQMTGLDHTTTHYYRAKAYHSTYGWLYGDEESFTTLPPIPEVETEPPSDTGDETIDAVGNIIDEGAASPTIRGFVYGLSSQSKPSSSTEPGDTGYDGHREETGTFTTGQFTIQLGNLEYGRIYYIRAYAYNGYGYAYGNEMMALTSDTVNLLYATGDSSRNIRFANPDSNYPHPYGNEQHYKCVRVKDGGYVPAGAGETGFGYVTGTRVYEHQYYAPDYFSDLYTLSNPIRSTGTIIKVKWRAQLLNNGYSVGGGYFWRLLNTHSTLYTGADPVSGGAPDYMVCEIFYNNPYTSAAWTLSEADDLLLGIKIYSGSGYETPSCCFLEGRVLWANAEVRTDLPTFYTGETGRMNGTVIEDEADDCEVYFEWGETDSYGNETTHQTDKHKNSTFYADLSGLDPDINYHYRAVIVTACGETFYGDDMVMDYEYGSLILEQAYSVEGNRQAAFASDPTWTDITEYLLSLRTKRGRLHEFDKVEAGTAVFTMDNSSGKFWRYNTGSEFYPDIQPLTLTRLRYRYNGTVYPVWYGLSEVYHPGWKANNEGGATPVIAIECVDFFKSFARYSLTAADIKLTEKVTAGLDYVYLENVDFLHEGQSVSLYQDDVSETLIISQIVESLSLVIFTTNVVNSYSAKAHIRKFPAVLAGQRIKDCLLEMGFPTALMDIDTGQHYVIAHTPPDEGTNILEHMQAVTEAEDGLLFVARDGKVTFQDAAARMSSPYNTSQATFNDDDTAQKYVHPSLIDDDTFIYNEVKILGSGIDPQQVVVGDKATEQGPRSLVRKESQLYFSTDAFVQAFVLAKRFVTSKLRCDTLLIKPQADPNNLYPVILGYDLSTRVTFNLNTATNPAAISKQYHVEGVEHEWDAFDNMWQTWWQLWTVNRYKSFSPLHDGYFRNYSSGDDYDTFHDEAAADYVENDGSNHNPYTDPDEIVIGQSLYYSILGFNGSIWRGFLEFDTSLLLSSDTPVAAFLLLNIKESFIDDREWDLVVVDPDTLANPLVDTDYGVLLSQTADQGSATMLRSGLWLVLELNSNGLNLLVPEGTTRLALRSEWDIAKDNNGGQSGYTNEYARLNNINTNYPPRLVIQLAE